MRTHSSIAVYSGMNYIQDHEKLTTYWLQGFHSCQLFYYRESLPYRHKWRPYSPFLVVHLSGKFLITHKCTNLWSIKNTCLDLLEGQTGERRKYVLEAFTVSIQRLDKLFHQAQLDMEQRKYDIFSTGSWVVDNIWHTCLQCLTYGPLLLVPVLFSSSALPHAKIAGVLCKSSLLT